MFPVTSAYFTNVDEANSAPCWFIEYATPAIVLTKADENAAIIGQQQTDHLQSPF